MAKVSSLSPVRALNLPHPQRLRTKLLLGDDTGK